MKQALGLVVVAAVMALGARAEAQQDELVVDDVECHYWSTVSFERSSSVVDLAAQADLNQALQWLFDVPGRYLYLLGADGPNPADVRIGRVRVSAVATFLVSNGATANSLMRGDFRELRTSRLQNGLRPSDVVVMNCEMAPVGP
jgi:hypothetical protein